MTGNTDSEQISVMVVDDHPMWRDGVSRDLQAAGLRVVATADGVASSGRIAATVKPDVVLMDMQLTDGDGAQATAAVLSASPHSHILVLSASAEREDVLEAVKAGATGYLVKVPRPQNLSTRYGPQPRGRRCSRRAWQGWCSVNFGACRARPLPMPMKLRGSPIGKPRYCGSSQRG